MEFKFQFALTAAEFADFNLYSVWSAREKRKLRIRTFLNTLFLTFGFSILGIFISGYLSDGNKTISFNNAMFWVIAIATAVVITTIFHLTIGSRTRSKARKLVQKEENNHILLESEVLVNEKGITHSDSKSQSIYSWASIVKYVDVYECYYLYISSVQAIIIPKRVLTSHNERDAFKKMLEQKVSIAAK